jgi:sugar (pentulose or hexulose) kinase
MMTPEPVIAVFDVGKTNKKLFLFNQEYKIVYERSARFTETADEDGFPCENLEALRSSLVDSLKEVEKLGNYHIAAINFSTYGASFIYIDGDGQPLSPLYNYLKPYPGGLQKEFYSQYGKEGAFARQTASPVLGSLNSGMQLYRIKKEKPALFAKIRYALHLPQYMSYLLTGQAFTDVTSLGCHTGLWDFEKQGYHSWVAQEHIIEKLAPIAPCDQVVMAPFQGKGYTVGIGLHDSSAALIPYTTNFHEPFMLLSTGTWCISLNPFNHSPLTADELSNDCLCYMDQNGNPVKASRLFAGHEHEVQTKAIAEYFNVNTSKFKSLHYDPKHLSGSTPAPFTIKGLSNYISDEEAYHHLIYHLVQQQISSSALVLKGTPVKRIFVDGGFSKNIIYMNLLAAAYDDIEVFAASMPQATALGAALAIHKSWNNKALPNDLIELNYYSANTSPLNVRNI